MNSTARLRKIGRRGGIPAIVGLVLLLGTAVIRYGFHSGEPVTTRQVTAPPEAGRDGELLARLRGRLGASVEIRKGRVAKVIDGDTLHLTDGTKIRYLGIDTPEKGSPFFQEAAQYNRRLTEGREITVLLSKKNPADGYGRILGAIFIAGGDGAPASAGITFVNAAMIRQGLANVYIKENDPLLESVRTSLIEAQCSAIDQGQGIFPGAIGAASREEPDVLATRHRYHRKDCAQLQKGDGKSATREASLRAGKSPCRTCRP